MLKPKLTNKFKRDYKRLEKRDYDMSLLDTVVVLLLEEATLPEKYKDHPLNGDKHGYRDCHIKDDWVLIYKIEKDVLTLVLSETGTHSDLFD